MQRRSFMKIARRGSRRVPGAAKGLRGGATKGEDHQGQYLRASQPKPVVQPKQHGGDGGNRCRDHGHRRRRRRGTRSNSAPARSIGKNPFRIEAIWQEMYIAWFYPPGREKTHAQGALDMALWDIKGKALGLPLHEMLGGSVP